PRVAIRPVWNTAGRCSVWVGFVAAGVGVTSRALSGPAGLTVTSWGSGVLLARALDPAGLGKGSGGRGVWVRGTEVESAPGRPGPFTATRVAVEESGGLTGPDDGGGVSG